LRVHLAPASSRIFSRNASVSSSRLDGFGHPRSEALRLRERFHRRDFGHMDLEVTVEDAKLYLKPITVKVTEFLVPDGDAMESFCNENEKDRAHLEKQ
jgi:virulence-associated protein VagC